MQLGSMIWQIHTPATAVIVLMNIGRGLVPARLLCCPKRLLHPLLCRLSCPPRPLCLLCRSPVHLPCCPPVHLPCCPPDHLQPGGSVSPLLPLKTVISTHSWQTSLLMYEELVPLGIS